MLEKERGFSISQEQATSVYRQLMIGSGAGRPNERVNRENLKAQLGIDSTTSSSPEDTVLGMLLIAYVNTTTRLIGTLKGEDPGVVNDRIHQQLGVPDGENSQQTLERLLNIAIENSQLINSPHS